MLLRSKRSCSAKIGDMRVVVWGFHIENDKLCTGKIGFVVPGYLSTRANNGQFTVNAQLPFGL